MNRLFIEDSNKEALTARVEAHLATRLHGPAKEITHGGHGGHGGLVILLQGRSGTGKSTTVECIAEHVNAPLTTVTCGELVSNLDSFESRLRAICDDAQKRNAILVIDQAESLLQDTDPGDFQMSAVQSMLIRQLESYRGVLFLVASHPESLDINETIRSRFHLAIRYRLPTHHARGRIWMAMTGELPDGDEKSALLKLTQDVAACRLNGWQMQSCLRTLVVSAQRTKKPITRRQLELALAFDPDPAISVFLLHQKEWESQILEDAEAEDVSNASAAFPITLAPSRVAPRIARSARPSMGPRRHTTQSSLSNSSSADAAWTWRMLPPHVRRPQLDFE